MSIDISLVVERYVFDTNITHNLRTMWREAGIEDALYESAGKQAGEILGVLRKGLADMEAYPEKYEPLSARNGWGAYRQALPWLRKLVAAFEENPDAVIRIHR